jgi:glyoxylase-like metal-dependent hydrolase (beta-lactamase superfamily II)
MSVKQVVPGVYEVDVGGVNVFVLDHDGVTLIDTGLPEKHETVLDGLKEIGHEPSELTNILISHYHWDHVGNLPHLKEVTGAKVHVASGDADLLRTGGSPPKMERRRGLEGWAISKIATYEPLPPMPVDEEISAGDVIPVADGVKVVDASGHTPGQVVFLWPEQGGVLFLADAAANMFGRLRSFPLAEDLAAADKTFIKLSELDFEVALFAHGGAITSGAAQKFRKVAAKYR